MSEPTEHDYITAESTATQEIIAEYADDLESLDAETAAELVNRFRNVGCSPREVKYLLDLINR